MVVGWGTGVEIREVAVSAVIVVFIDITLLMSLTS